MHSLEMDIRSFRQRKQHEHAYARQLVALSLCAGIDMKTALEAEPSERRRLLLRLERMIERERLRGVRRHWAYDLNRHISLKQALDVLRDASVETKRAAASRLPLLVDRKIRQKLTSSCDRGPSSSQAPSARGRSSARPSGSSGPGPTSRDTGQASGRNASSGDASAT